MFQLRVSFPGSSLIVFRLLTLSSSQVGHRKMDCPEPPKADDRPCFNCGEVGHMKTECPNPRKPREATEDTECQNCGGKGIDNDAFFLCVLKLIHL